MVKQLVESVFSSELSEFKKKRFPLQNKEPTPLNSLKIWLRCFLTLYVGENLGLTPGVYYC